MDSYDLLSPKIRKIARDRFKNPTSIQELAIPEILGGKNVLVVAGTGFGKTESVMLPVFNKVMENPSRISVLYITPLRSLNRDMFDRLFWWSDKLDLEIAIRHGDTLQKERSEHRDSPPNILIITPESLQAVITGKIMQKHLANVKYVVVDEIHEIVGSKRGTQLSVILERLRKITGGFQTIGISATIGSPDKVAQYIGNASIVKSDIEKEMEVSVQLPKPKPEDSKLEDKLFVDSFAIARLREIIDIIKSHKSSLIFSNTRQTAEVLSSRLRVLEKDMKQDVHHGSLAKEVRIKNETMFKNQELKAIVATSSLELGIDIGSVDIVVQYLSPRQVSKLIQRVGRAGHRAGEKSFGILLTDKDDVFESSVINKNFMTKNIEPTRMHENALDVLSHQIIGMAMDEYGIKSQDIYDTIKKSYCFRNLSKKEFDEVLEFLKNLRMVYIDKENGNVKRSRKAFQYYYENLTTIADTHQYLVFDMISNEPVGSLDETFVAEHGQSGDSFICKGRGWKVVEVDKNRVLVEPYDQIESAIPSWEGELIPVPLEIAAGVGRLRKKIADGKYERKDMMKEYGIDANSLDEMEDSMSKQKKFFIPDDKTIAIENYQDFILIHSCCGSMINDTLGRYISTVLTAKYGISVQMKTNPYSIILKTVGKKEDVLDILKNPEDFESTIMDSIENSTMFKWRFTQNAKRFGVIERGAYFDKINVGKLVSFYRMSPVYDETIREVKLEKIDIEGAKKILDMVKSKAMKVMISEGTSPLGNQNLIYQFGELISPKEPDAEIYKFFRRRLLNTQIMTICMNCGKYSLTRRVGDFEDEPECPLCGSRLMGAVSKGAHLIPKIVKKKIDGKKLTKEETIEYDRARRTADMVIVYGKKAVFVLAAKGVGAEIASRILSKLPPTEEQLMKEIFEAEKQFAKNHKYWK